MSTPLRALRKVIATNAWETEVEEIYVADELSSGPDGRMKVGVILPQAEDDGQILRYSELRDTALRAEAAGLDSVWVFDHLLFRFPDQPTAGIWEVWTVLSALAEATTRVELGTLVMCVPFRHPALLAKMAVTVDEVSGGRFILGLGAGWHQPEFDAFGMPFDHKVDRFEEALKIITPLLREGKVDYRGTHYAAPQCELRPRGPRDSGPPVLVASFKLRMLRLTAQYADSWNTAWLGTDMTQLSERRRNMDAACAEVGRDSSTVTVTVGVRVEYPKPDEMSTSGDYISGSPEQVAAALRAYEEAGVSHLICACSPNKAESYEQLGEALRILRV